MKESGNLHILRVTCYSKMTFEKHIRWDSTAAPQRVAVVSSEQLFGSSEMLLGFGVLPCPFLSYVLQCGARLQILTVNYWAEESVLPVF